VRGDGIMVRRVPSGTEPAGGQGEEEALRRLVLRQLSDFVSVATEPRGVRVMLSMTVA
jgi:hypothetical protein